jgi:hypothetical protein
MYCLDVVRMIVPPPSAHSFRIFVVGDDIRIIGEVLVADGAYAPLFSDLPVHQFPYFRRRSQFPISSRVVGILNSLNSKSDYLGSGKRLPPTTENRLMDWAQFIGTKSHGIPLFESVENETELVSLVHWVSGRGRLPCYNSCPKEDQ